MGNNQFPPFILAVLIAFYALFSMYAYSMPQADDQNPKLHIVYLKGRPHLDPNFTTYSHHQILTTILGSMEKSSESMVYSYRHGFSGFAAKLTKSQAQKLAEIPGVVRVLPNSVYKAQTTRSWDFLGLSAVASNNSNLLHRGEMGKNIIIGVIDSGIWPESEAFGDKEMGPIPSRWKGTCEAGKEFSSANCNKKIIGARWYSKGFTAVFGQEAVAKEYLSPRDVSGHGTHVASIAAGSSFVTNASYRGLGGGTVRGGAPLARLAIYKALWGEGQALGTSADILKAIDEAIHDGVDVLTLSLGREVPLFPEFSEHNEVAIGSFHAIARGISVVCAGGNQGPDKQTVINTAPWVLTVAASTMDRAFLSPITTLGDNATYLGQSLFSSEMDIVGPLAFPSTARARCKGMSANDSSISGKVVLCFSKLADLETTWTAAAAAIRANGIGIIVAGQHNDNLFPCPQHFPCILVDNDIATKLFFYALQNSNPVVRLRRARTIIGQPISSKIPYFSARGPNSAAPAILKPDIAAPGSNIVAAIPRGVGIQSGSSMAAPHISGIVALLKSVHPTWSPAAIKSALITTARAKDPSGFPFFAEGDPPKVADPFDYGGGVVDPNAADDPGLIYDLNTTDYINYYLCAMGYEGSDISHLTEQQTECPLQRASLSDLNLPTITVPALTNYTSVTRTVTNVGNLTSIYRAVIEAPPGIKVSVEPQELAFNSQVKKISFKVTFSTALHRTYGYSFGTLTWSDGVHLVKTPLSVRIDFLS